MDAQDVAALLKTSVGAVFELTRNRSQVRGRHPLPCVKIHSKMLRFRRSDVEQWLNNIAQSQAAKAGA
jgi:predicted DNA-binding transcriptional regulator AlpA